MLDPPSLPASSVLAVLLVLVSACGSRGHVQFDAAEVGITPEQSWARQRGLQQGSAYVPPFNPNVQPHCNGLDDKTLPRCGTNQKAPFSRRSKVAIIGAGVSGLTMAKLLQDRGFTNVHLLEKTGRAGGYPETYTFQDVPHEHATCYTVGRYECVLRLIDEAFITPVPFPPSYKTVGDAILLGNTSFGLQQYWFFYVTRLLSPPKQYAATPQGVAQFGQDVVQALIKYKQLYFQYLGSGQYLFPPQPSADKLRALNVTFGQFLQDNDLMILVPYLHIAVTFQGYGHFSSVPAFYALMWFSPNFVDAVLRDVQGLPPSRPGTYASMLREGFGTFFQRVASRLPNIRLNVSISKVRRTTRSVEITWSSGSAASAKLTTEKFDFLIVASRMPASLSFLDARPDEVDVFGRLVHRYLDVTHVNVTGFPTRSPLIYQVTGVESLKPNLITMVRNDVAMLNRYLIPTPDAADIRLLLTETINATTEQQNKAAILAQLKTTWGVATAAITRYGHYEYHSAFTAAEVTQGYPWKLRALQGKYRTWYAGSFASFESVADVLDYNYQLISKELCE